PTVHMQALLKTLGKTEIPDFKPILEINPTHSIIRKLEHVEDGPEFEETCLLLFEQAMLVEGMKLEDAAAFAKRLNNMLDKAMGKN
ncbi:MAG: molecular chaperone HtpG, partial [Spirochaetes bacterium]|nr:molecular chaperone HtpG [Spirochaetota bacterium]